MQSKDRDLTCRVCRTPGDAKNPLFHPCKCSGSMKYVHQECLETWLIHSRKRKCEICWHRFIFESVYSRDLKGGVTKTLILKVAFFEIIVLLNQIGKALLAIVIWIFLTPYCARCLWTFYFDPSSIFKFFSAVLCRLYRGSCGVLLIMTRNPDLLEVFPSLSNLPSLFFGVSLHNSAEISTSSHFSADQINLSNLIKEDPYRGAYRYILYTLRRKFSLKVVAYDIVCGQAITLAVLLSALALTFIREHMSFDALSEAGINEHNFAASLVSPPSSYSDENDGDTEYLRDASDESGQDSECAESHSGGLLSPSELLPNAAEQENDTSRAEVVGPSLDRADCGENAQDSLDYMYLTRIGDNVDTEPESDFSTMLSILGVNGRISNLIKNFIFTNIVIATFVGGVMWIPYCVSNLLLIIFKEVYYPLIKITSTIVTAAIEAAYLYALAVLKALAYVARSMFSNGKLPEGWVSIDICYLVFRPILMLRSFVSKIGAIFQAYPVLKYSDNSVELTMNTLEGGEDLLNRVLSSMSISENDRTLPFSAVYTAAYESSGAAHAASPISSTQGSTMGYLSSVYSETLLRAGGVITTILVKKIIIVTLILFHMRRIGWLRQFNRASPVYLLKKSLRIITKTLEIAAAPFLSMIVLPIIYGVIADFLTLPVFGPTATVKNRWGFFINNPLTSGFIHWTTGTALMSTFVYYFSTVRSVLRPGVLWFVKDPVYPRRELSDDLVKQPFLYKVTKSLFGASLYACAIVMCLGGFVAAMYTWDSIFSRLTKGGGPLQIWPLQWDFSDSPFIFPVDLMFFYFFAVKIVSRLRPFDTVRWYVMLWFVVAARLLRVSHFLVGVRQPDEESECDDSDCEDDDPPGHETYLLRRLIDRFLMRFNRSGQKRECRFMRVPDDNDIITAPRDQTYLPLKTIQDSSCTEGKIGNDGSSCWRVVYVPPNFKMRILILVFANWVFNVTLVLIFSATFLMLGRYAFNGAFRMYGHFIGPNSIFNTVFKISSPAEPMAKYLKSNRVNFVNDSGRIDNIYKSVCLSMLMELRHCKDKSLELLKGNIGAVDHILDNTNGVYGISNYALVNRYLWNRIIRPDLAVHDTYSFFAGIHICILGRKTYQLIRYRWGFIHMNVVSVLKILGLFIVWIATSLILLVIKKSYKLLISDACRNLFGNAKHIHEGMLCRLKLLLAKMKRVRSSAFRGAASHSRPAVSMWSYYRGTFSSKEIARLIYRASTRAAILCFRIIILAGVVIVIPTLVGLAFELGTLELMSFILYTLRISHSVLSLAKIPESWLRTKSNSELFTYVFTNEWAFGTVLINTLHIIKRSRSSESQNRHSSRLLSMRGLVGDLQPSFLKTIVFPIFVTCMAIIFFSLLCKVVVFKILCPWVAIIGAVLLVIKAHDISHIHPFFCHIMERLGAGSDMCDTGPTGYKFTLPFAISLILFILAIVLAIAVSCSALKKYFEKIKMKAHNQAFLVGHRLHNYEPDNGAIGEVTDSIIPHAETGTKIVR